MAFQRALRTPRHTAGAAEAEERADDGGLATELRDQLRFRIRKIRRASAMDSEPISTATSSLDVWELRQAARELNMSIEDVRLVKYVFDSFDVDGSGTLDLDEFEQAVVKLLQLQLQEPSLAPERAKAICSWCWWDADGDNSGSITFREFLKWYCSNGFKEDLLLTENEQWLRSMAKKYKVNPNYVETIKRCFDTYDTDHSGEVDVDEFKQVLYKALKIPTNLELPASRIAYFWGEVDGDGSGSVVFEEFLQWWLRYFDGVTSGQQGELPFEGFYRQVRRLGDKHLDPPAYPKKSEQQASTDVDDFLDGEED